MSLLTLTTSLTLPFALALTLTTMDEALLVFDCMVAAVQVTVPLLPLAGVVHVHPDGAVTLSKPVALGSWLVMITREAPEGPLLVTVVV